MKRLANLGARLGLGDELGRVLARGVGAALLVRVSGMASSLALYLVLARLLEPTGFGHYALALSWLNVLAMVATLGTDNGALRFVAQYRIGGAWAELRGYQLLASRLSLIVGATLAVVAAFVAVLALQGAAAWTFAIVFMAIPFVAQIAQRQAVLRAYGSVMAALVPEQVARPVIMVILLVALATAAPVVAPIVATGVATGVAPGVTTVVATGVTPLGAAACLLGATLCSFALGRWLLAQRQPPQLKATAPRYDTALWLRTALRLGVFSWLYALVRQMDLLMVGALSPIQDAGVYAVATRCADIAIFVSLAIDAIIAPMVARLHAEGDRVRLGTLVRRGARIALALTAPTCIALWLAGPWVLSWFGATYSAGYAPLAILLAGQLLAAATGYGTYLLTMTGRETDALVLLLAAVVVDVLANLVLIPLYGNVGAAGATLLTALVWRSGCVLLAWWRLGINPLPFGRLLR